MTTLALPSYRLAETDLVLDMPMPYRLRVRDLARDEKPREKLIAQGPATLSVSELLAVVLNTGTKKEGVLEMSRRLLKDYGEKAIIHEKNPEKLSEALDIPLGKSCQVVACLELGRRFYKTGQNGKPAYLRTAKQVFDYLRDMQTLPKEHLRGLYLDSHFRLIHDEVISIGTVGSNLVHPREVFKPALDVSAVAVIMAHNHPSGVPTPSEADVEVTQQLVEAGKILGIEVLDHVIVAREGFASVPADYS